MYQVSADARSLTQATRALDALSRSMRDLRPLWELVSVDFWATGKARFDSKNASRGAQWEPLGPRYGALKRYHYGDLPLLVLSGTLRRSLTQKGAPGGVQRMTPEALTIGTSVEYAERVQLGTTDDVWIPAPFNITIHGHPARPIVDLQPDDESRWQRLAVEWAEGIAKTVARWL